MTNVEVNDQLKIQGGTAHCPPMNVVKPTVESEGSNPNHRRSTEESSVGIVASIMSSIVYHLYTC